MKKRFFILIILGLWPNLVWADRVSSYSKVTCLPEEGFFSFEYPTTDGTMEYAWDMKEKLELWEKYGFVEDTSDFSDPEGELEMDSNSTAFIPLPLSQQKHVFTKYCPIGDGVTFRIKRYSMGNGSGPESYRKQMEIQYGDKMLYSRHEFFRRIESYPLLSAKLQVNNSLDLELELGAYSEYVPHYLMGLKLQCKIDDEILSSTLLPFNLERILNNLDQDHEDEAFPREYNINCKQLLNNQ